MNNQQKREPFAPAVGAELEENQRAISRRMVIMVIAGFVLLLVCMLGFQFGLLIGQRLGG